MPRQPKASNTTGIKDNTLIVDNGGYTIKAGFVTASPSLDDCHVIPNCIARDVDKKVWVGSQLDQCKDFGGMAFRRPVDKGYLVNWESEKAVWGQSFLSQNSLLQCDPHETNLILTEAPNCPQALQTNCDQMVFEEFEFASYCRYLGPAFNAFNDIATLFGGSSRPPDAAHIPAECLLLIDSGYSHTTITPLIGGRPVQQAIRRLDVGGKFLTNYLKEQLSIRQKGVMEETYVVNELKESMCFVSQDFRSDLERTWKGGIRDRRTLDSSVIVDYALPDYVNDHKGVEKPYDPLRMPKETDYIVTLGNERFTAPELLFSPADIGLKEAGLPEVIMECVDAIPSGIRPAMLANIVLVGGNIKIRGFMKRLEIELQKLAPSEYHVRVASSPDPIKATWLGGARMVSHPQTLRKLLVTREEYLEHGASWVQRKFSANGK